MMSSGPARRVSRQDIQLVQNLIECCLQLYMNQNEVVQALLVQAKIEPGITELANRNLVSYPEYPGEVKPKRIQHPTSPGSTDAFMNDEASLHATMPSAIKMPAHVNRIDVNSQNSYMVLMQGINGEIVKTEYDYTRVSPCMFGAESKVLAPCSTIGDMSVASFCSVESTSQPLNEPLLDADNSFGFLGHLSSDFTADFSQSSDILENYARSPFLARDANNFLDVCERGEQVTGPVGRLDPICEGMSYEDFVNR
ncbi:hypothetical protein SAY87_021981 [Trapa incisa]|uniref:Uncharacterized protein n=1 Tax=Trapa incisa TaxID=236973 RepID=A0AAN7PT42_9MYRT|nr:hypothetical protein SAY87_021981 [Trapa incisa]